MFELNPEGSVKVLHSFQGLEDGASPLAGLFRDNFKKFADGGNAEISAAGPTAL